MIHFKNNSRNGFSLIEVMFAVAIIAMIFAPLFIVQGNSLQHVFSMAQRMQRIILAQNFMYEAQRIQDEHATQFTLEKKEDNPLTVLSYILGPVDKKSALSEIKGLYMERVTIAWQEGNRHMRDILVTFIYKPEQKKI